MRTTSIKSSPWSCSAGRRPPMLFATLALLLAAPPAVDAQYQSQYYGGGCSGGGYMPAAPTGFANGGFYAPVYGNGNGYANGSAGGFYAPQEQSVYNPGAPSSFDSGQLEDLEQVNFLRRRLGGNGSVNGYAGYANGASAFGRAPEIFAGGGYGGAGTYGADPLGFGPRFPAPSYAPFVPPQRVEVRFLNSPFDGRLFGGGFEPPRYLPLYPPPQPFGFERPRFAERPGLVNLRANVGLNIGRGSRGGYCPTWP